MITITLKHGSTDKVTSRLRKAFERGGPELSWPDLMEKILADCDIRIGGYSSETRVEEEAF